MLPSPPDEALMALVTAADADLAAAHVDRAILHVNDLAPPERSLTWFPVVDVHPFDMLAGFTAPPHWRAVGVSSTAWAHRLDDDGRRLRDPGASRRVQATLLLDRAGGAAGVMRVAGDVVPLPGRPEGTIADACRRALGLPTAPPPPSTLGLWTLGWLDRLVDVAGRADGSSRLRSWAQAAELHAAAGPRLGRPDAPPDPVALAAAAAALAEAWTWSRLRAEPALADVPGPAIAAPLAAWMDDGMWARWLLARLPGEADLIAGVHALLPPALAGDVMLVVRAAAGEAAEPVSDDLPGGAGDERQAGAGAGADEGRDGAGRP
jgi:hypothetical protein